MTNNNTDEPLDWLAFRYVAGELSSDETAAFEQRLADDQAACDAVVRAMQLCEAIALAERSASTRERPLPHRMPMAIRAMLAAAIAAGVVLTAAWRPLDSTHDMAPPCGLAEVWSEQIDAENMAAENDMEVEDSLIAADIPAWMLEAVRELDAETETPMDHRRES
jgi:anti-sigma factor RsiW